MCPVGAELFLANGRTDEETDMTELKMAFRSFTNAPKKTPRRARWPMRQYFPSGIYVAPAANTGQGTNYSVWGCL